MSSYYEKILATGEVKCIDEEIPFEIPQGWEWTRIGNIFNHTSGKQQSSSNKGGGTPQKFITTSNLYWGHFILDNVKVMNFTDEEIKTCSATKGDLLVCEGGAGYGRSAIWNENYDICLQNHVHRLRPCVSGICKYVYYFIYLLKESNNLASVGTAMPGLSANRLKGLLLPFPPLSEQRRIVAKLAELLPQIEKYNNVQNKLNELNTTIKDCLKKSILQEAIQGKLVPQLAEEGTAQELLEQIKTEKQKLVKEGKLKKSALKDSVIFKGDDNKYWEKSGDNIVCIDEDIPFGIPSSWSWCRLGNIASVKGGKRIPVGEKLTTGNTGHMYIRVADMKENTVKTDDIHYISESIYQKIKSYTISTEDLYITVAGTIGSVGEIPKVFDNANLTENADKIVFRGICRKFLMYCLLSNFVQSQIKKCTTKVGQPKLAIVRIEDLVIPLPPIKEQYRIAHKIEQTASIMSR